jgi:hypothetical protein
VLTTALSGLPEARPVALLDDVAAILDVPDALIDALAQLPGLALATADAVPDLDAFDLAPETRFWLQAWNQMLDPAHIAAMNARASTWLDTDVLCSVTGQALAPPGALPTLTDTVAVGVLIMDGPAEAQIQASEYLDITVGMLHAFDILYRNAPPSARLVFLAEQRRIALSVAPFVVPAPVPGQTSWDQLENRERVWRDPALQSIGLLPGFAGVDQYRNQLIAKNWAVGPPQKAIVAVVTKYNTGWFAYAANGRFVVQLPWATSQVGPDNVDRVMAHEASHLFGALDEYQPCSPATTSGPFAAPNGNCLVSPFLPHAPCLMGGESDDMCPWTKAHVGWQPFV